MRAPVAESFPMRRELNAGWIPIGKPAFRASMGQSTAREIGLGIFELGIDLEISAPISPFV